MKKFKYALNGIKLCFQDKSILIQVILGILTLLISIILKLKQYDFIIILICIFLVISIEIINTCIEKLCNLYSISYNKQIKIIKDLSASAVLIVSIMAFIIGLLIFVPYL